MKSKILSKHIKDKMWLLIISGLFAVLSTIATFVPFFSVYKVIEQLVLQTRDYETMKYWGLVAFGSLLFGLLLQGVSAICSHIAAFDILYKMRISIMKHLSKLSMGYHSTHSSGAIIKTVEQSVEKIENFVAHQIPDVVAAIVFPIMYIIAMFMIDYRLAIVSIIPIVLSVTFMGKMQGDIMKTGYVKQYHDALEDMNSNGVEYIRAMPAVKIFNLRVESFKKFFKSINDYRNFVYQWSLSFKKSYILFNNTLLGIFLFVLPMGGYLLNNDPRNISLGLTVLIFFVLTPGLSTPIIKLMYTVSGMTNIFEGVSRIDAIFDEKPLKESKENKEIINASISIDNISFSYDDKKEVLHNISLHIPEKRVTALVGPSGGGKSTLASLLLRFYDVQEGSIKIGD
ncbi:MAG: ABC transporter transmembrane domain-containing protein, partial [Coprobacillaceae bacterium]